jgi:hypothetical protein
MELMDMRTWRDSRRRADAATAALREALAGLGVPEHVRRGLRPVVTHSGVPYVHIGMVRAEYVESIAEALGDAVGVPRREASSSADSSA